MIVGIHHIAICVPDFEQGLAFYRDQLGFAVVQESAWDRDYPLADMAIGLNETAARMAMLKGPNAFIELWEYQNPEPADHRQRPCDYGYPHFCLQVDGIQEEYDRLCAAGMRFAGPPVDFGEMSAIYGKDPFGNVIELYEIRSQDIAQLNRGAEPS